MLPGHRTDRDHVVQLAVLEARLQPEPLALRPYPAGMRYHAIFRIQSRRTAARRASKGYSLIEVMIATGLGATLLAGALAVSATARADARAERLLQDLSALVRDIRTSWGGPHGSGYAGITPQAINARSDAMTRSYVDAGPGGHFKVYDVEIQVGASSLALDGNESPVDTGRIGDSFIVQLDGLSGSACIRLLAATAHDATAASVGSGAGATPVSVRAHSDLGDIAAACGKDDSVQVAIHFN